MTGIKGKYWQDITDGSNTYKMDHLHPFSFTHTKQDNTSICIHVSFENHVFTDDKRTSHIQIGDRYFSLSRYECSKQLRELITTNFMDNHVVVYKNKKDNESYYYTEKYDYAIFFNMAKIDNNTLKMKVISAYEVDSWGKSTLPRGNKITASYLTHLKLTGKSYSKTKKR
ncbi:hypothetical protein AB7080_20760 [Providencia rettgeri]|uniref:hypothetical protein n=1 Tax=Providencia sp. PROV214 TaxID=2949910 RepID=UPI00234B7336|nr:hypothetical protein [Providencia sp. PROV214]